MIRWPLPSHQSPIMGGVAHLGQGVCIGFEVLGIAGLVGNILRDICHLPCETAAAAISPLPSTACCWKTLALPHTAEAR